VTVALVTPQDEWNTRDGEMLGQPPTFEWFFDAERDRLFRALCVITGSRTEAEDIAQDAFVKVLERWDRVSRMDDPAGYLHRTAMNLFRNRYRRAAVALRAPLRPAPVHDVYEAVERRDAIDRALASLTPRQRAALVLTEILRYPAGEAGRMLGVKESTVRALVFQARSTIRKQRDDSDV
jgi:RNA polymerase sigma-70 factor (ECF subfamily)